MNSANPGWFKRLKGWQKTLFVLAWPLSGAYGTFWMWRMKRFPLIIRVLITGVYVLALAILFGALAAGGNGTSPSASSAPDPSSPAPASTTPVGESRGPVAPPADEVSGIGALRTTWDSLHTPDERFEPGTAYDPSPELGKPPFNDKYYAVLGQDRIFSYSVRYPAGTTLEQAIDLAGEELPPDREVVWREDQGLCYKMAFRSETLVIPDLSETGQVVVMFTGESGEGYDSTNVTNAHLLFMDASAEETWDC